jgi:hypothetical protein
MQLFGCRACDSAAKEELERKAQRIAMRSTQPIYILREALQYLAHQRVVISGYTYLQDMVGRVVTGERKRITQLLSHALTPAVEERLAALLQSDEGMYRISVLKHEPKNFSYQELWQEVERRKFFQPLYEFAQTFLSSTGLSNESVKYYASLAWISTAGKALMIAVRNTGFFLENAIRFGSVENLCIIPIF